MEPTEKNLIERLYRERFPQLYRYARALLADESAALEAVQETFRLACAKAPELAESPNPAGWLTEALRYTVLRARRIRRQDAIHLAALDLVPLADRPQEDDLDLLYGDLAGSKEYELLKKFAVEGRSIRELAEAEGITVAACKQQLYRARIKLRRLLAESKPRGGG